MFAACVQENALLEIRQVPDPVLPSEGALVRVTGCGLCGSDLDKLLHGKAAPGDVLGHEVVGVLETLHTEQPSFFLEGQRVVMAHHVPCGQCHYCRQESESMCRAFKTSNIAPGGFAQRIALSGEHLLHTTFAIPDHVSDPEASCVEPLACVLKAVRRGRALCQGPDPSVVIVGLGFIGLLAAQVYRSEGYRVFGIDMLPERVEFARNKGFLDEGAIAGDDGESLLNRISDRMETGGVDLVFLTCVNPPALRLAERAVRDGGILILFASGRGASMDLDSLYFREISVISSYSPALTDLKRAADMIFQRKIDVASLVTHTLPLDRVGEAVPLARSGEAIKVFIEC